MSVFNRKYEQVFILYIRYLATHDFDDLLQFGVRNLRATSCRGIPVNDLDPATVTHLVSQLSTGGVRLGAVDKSGNKIIVF